MDSPFSTDNNGNTYVQACTRSINNGSDYETVNIYYVENVAVNQASFTVTVTPSASTEVLMRVIEYSNVATSGALDQTANNTNTSTSANSGTTGTTTSSNQVVAAAISLESYGGVSITATGGYTSRGTTTNGINPMGGFADKIISTTGTQQATWTLGSSTKYAACVATFK